MMKNLNLRTQKALPGMSVFSNTQELDDYLAKTQKKVLDGE